MPYGYFDPTIGKSILDRLTSSVIPRNVSTPIINKIDEPALDRGRTEAQLRGFLAGGTQGALDAFTNPLSLATAGGSILSRLLSLGRTASEVAPVVAQAVRAAKPSAEAFTDINRQMAALEQEIHNAERLAGSMTTGPHWTSGSIQKVIEPLRQELRNLQVLKATRGVENTQAAAEAADQAAFRATRNAAQRASTAPPKMPRLEVVNPESINPQDYKGNPEEVDALIKAMRQRLGLTDEPIPTITEITGQRTSSPTRKY